MNIYQKWNKNQLIRFKRKWGKEDMANLQWLKLSTDFFDNNKIKLLESEKDGDTIIRVWIQLLITAMKCNYQGRLSLTEDKPMTVDEFSKIMGKSRKKITKCLEKFEELKGEMDPEKRKDLIFQMQQILVDDAAVLIDGYYNSSMIYSKKVGSAHIHTADYYWLSTEITPAE